MLRQMIELLEEEVQLFFLQQGIQEELYQALAHSLQPSLLMRSKE